MLVVLIIGILVSIIGPQLLGKTGKAKIQACKAQLMNIKTALSTYEMMAGELPTTDQGLEALVRRPSDVDEEDWEQHMEHFPKDPFGNAFVYQSPGEDDKPYDLYSMGKDKKEGTDDDVYLYDKDDDSKDYE
jgi:general secretion pathway protein G